MWISFLDLGTRNEWLLFASALNGVAVLIIGERCINLLIGMFSRFFTIIHSVVAFLFFGFIGIIVFLGLITG